MEQLTAMAGLGDADVDGNAASSVSSPTQAPDMMKSFIAGSRLIHEFNIDRVDLTMRLLLHVTDAIARLVRAVNSGIRSVVEAAVSRARDDLNRAKVS